MSIGTYLNFVLSLIFVLGLIGVSAWLYRRFVGNSGSIAGRLAGSGRLAVVEHRALDARRKLVLVRRDGVEHLLLLGASSELVVESGIAAPRASATGDRQ